MTWKVIVLGKPSNFDDEDVLQQIFSNFVLDNELDVDQNQWMNGFVLVDMVVVVVVSVEVLSPVHSLHIHQHLIDEHQEFHWTVLVIRMR